jgi:hypothetical protein
MGPVPVQMCTVTLRGKPSPRADVAGVGPVSAQMWQRARPCVQRSEVERALREARLCADVPTLFVAECVLVYLERAAAARCRCCQTAPNPCPVVVSRHC